MKKMATNYNDLRMFVQNGRKILAVGRNYKAHAQEMNNPMPEKPLLFMKPTSSYIEQGESIRFPKGCKELHHEVELGVVIGQRGTDIPIDKVMDFVAGYTVALDMTARDFQQVAQKKGHSWLLSKGFDTACPIGPFVAKDLVRDPHDLHVWLKVNDKIKQDGNTREMHFKIPEILSYVSGFVTLEPGDLVLTGTPEGVGPVKSGDVIEAGIDGLATIKFKVQ